MAATQRKLVHKQFNSPMGLYSQQNVKETLNRELKAFGEDGIEIDEQISKPLNLANSAVLRAVEEEEQVKCGYKRVAWPPVSEERIVREFTPQPQTQASPQTTQHAQQQPQQHYQQHLQHNQQPTQHQQYRASSHDNYQQQQQQHRLQSYSPQPTHPPRHQQPTHPPHHQQPTHPTHHQQPSHPPHNQQPTHPPHHQQPTHPPRHQQPTHPPHFQQQQQFNQNTSFQQNQYQQQQEEIPSWAHNQRPSYQSQQHYQPTQSRPTPPPQSQPPSNYQSQSHQPTFNQYNSYSQNQQQPPQQQQYSSQDQQDFQQQQPHDYRGTSPGMITLRKETPINQAPVPVYTSQPAAINYQGGSNMRGDLKWPPPEYKEAAARENEERRKVAQGPVCRPRKVHRDYTSFFAKNALSHHYPSYKVPPGTQHIYD